MAWDISRGDSTIVIAVLDTGLDVTHPDVNGKNTYTGYDFINGDFGIQDDQGHGTNVAGIAAASTNNGLGVAGACWNCQIMPVKVCDADGNCLSSVVQNGIYWAVDHGANVINMSLAGATSGFGAILWQDAIDYAYNDGVVVAAAAGNNNEDLDVAYSSYPAQANHVIAVGATNEYDLRCDTSYFTCLWWWPNPGSGHGSSLDVMAPGVLSLWSTDLMGSLGYSTGDYSTDFGGTSAATAFVSGLAGLILSVNPSLSPDQVENIIEQSAVDLGVAGRDNFFGYGRIDAYAAVSAARCYALTIVPTTGGTVSVTPPNCAGGKYLAGTWVQATANPSPGYTFWYWTGLPINDNNPTIFQMNSDGYLAAHFQTASANSSPYTPSNPLPPNGATNVSTGATLNWTGGDPDAGDTVTYDVYMGSSSTNLILVSSNQGAISYNPGPMSPGTTYYWQVLARDNHGATSTGPIWYFTTAGSGNDTTPPTASWVSPSNGQTITSQTVRLQANASDNSSGVNRVAFSAKWGGTWRGLATDYSALYIYDWDLCGSGVPDGDIELGLEAWDNAGNHYVYSEHFTNYHITKSYNSWHMGARNQLRRLWCYPLRASELRWRMPSRQPPGIFSSFP